MLGRGHASKEPPDLVLGKAEASFALEKSLGVSSEAKYLTQCHSTHLSLLPKWSTMYMQRLAKMFTRALHTAEAGNNPDADTAEQWEGAKASMLLTQQSSLPRKEPDTTDCSTYRCSGKGKSKERGN